jgi:methylase of polypeptide subunit release factors
MRKELLNQIDRAANTYLPLISARQKALAAWASLHGWDASLPETHQLLVRQALLNDTIRQIVPDHRKQLFSTPLDSLPIQAPASLVATLQEASRHISSFNFWGELYSALIPQAQRRRIGQFWTSEAIAEWMVAWLLQARPRRLVDIGCGAGNFLLKAAQLQGEAGAQGDLYGLDISPVLLNVAQAAFLASGARQPDALPSLTVQNYLTAPLPPGIEAVVCNPPYTRHHDIPPETKDVLQTFFLKRLHLEISRQGTLAFYFLLKLIADMPEGARAAVILPMEVLDARYGRDAKRVLCQHTTISALVHFSPQMNAFRKVDVGASILLFRKGYEPHNPVRHLTLMSLPKTHELLDCLEAKPAGRQELTFGSLSAQPQDEMSDVGKWFSIAVSQHLSGGGENSGLVVPLKALARIVRGIATGANEFFALSSEQVQQYGLEPYVVRTLQRNREVQDIILDEAGWQALSDEGRRVWLLYLKGENVDGHPALRAYVARGEAHGYHRRALVQTRKKWYAMEQRDIPAIFFTILTRGNPRFILNRAGVRPLNMFSLIYPNRYVIRAGAVELLWVLLNASFSLSRLHSVSRTYGGNTLKVEPRELDNLPVINPLALPAQTRQQIKRQIDDFFHHRQAAKLLDQVNGLVRTLLAAGDRIAATPSVPVQLRLLEPGARYATPGKEKHRT